jgi:hypothetical protein
MEEVKKIAQFLEDEVRPFTLEEVERALQRYNLDVDVQSLAKEVVEEGVRRTLESLGGLWKMLGVPPVWEVEAALRQGGSLRAVCLNWWDGTWVSMTINQRHDLSFGYPFPEYQGPKGFVLHAWAGKVELNTYSGIYATRERVFFSARGVEDIREALADAKALRPLLESMKIAGLDKAIEELASLGDGETRTTGEYLLARSGDIFALRRGGVLGDLTLDGALLTQRDVALTFPGDVELSFKVEWLPGKASFHYLRIRWGEDEVSFGGAHQVPGNILSRDPLTPALRGKVRCELKPIEVGKALVPERYGLCSPKVLAFLRVFAEHEDPLHALAEGKLRPYVTAELFSEI